MACLAKTKSRTNSPRLKELKGANHNDCICLKLQELLYILMFCFKQPELSNALLYVINETYETNVKSICLLIILAWHLSPLGHRMQHSTNVYFCSLLICLYYHYSWGYTFDISATICQAADGFMAVGANGWTGGYPLLIQVGHVRAAPDIMSLLLWEQSF